VSWVRADLLSRLLPPGPGIVLGIGLGDRWSEIRARHDRWFTCGDRRLERVDADGTVVFEAADERDEPGDDVHGFQLDVRGHGANVEVVHGIAADLRAAFGDRYGRRSRDEIHTIYNLPPHAYDERTKLWTRVFDGGDGVRFSVWTDLG
jgi:hypothetical protein